MAGTSDRSFLTNIRVSTLIESSAGTLKCLYENPSAPPFPFETQFLVSAGILYSFPIELLKNITRLLLMWKVELLQGVRLELAVTVS